MPPPATPFGSFTRLSLWALCPVLTGVATLGAIGACAPSPEAARVEHEPIRPEAPGVVEGPTPQTPVSPSVPPAVAAADRTSPDGWGAQDSFEGLTIERSTDRFKDGGVRRVAYYLPGPTVHEALQGPAWHYFPNGTLKSMQYWREGVQQGVFRCWFPSGLLRWDGTYVNGQRDGMYRQYHKGGDIQYEFEYATGVPQGVWKEYLAGGVLSQRENFDAGRLHGRRQTWVRAEGEDPRDPDALGAVYPVLDETYQAGTLQGPMIRHHLGSTEVQARGAYDQGERSGVWETFHVNGQLATSCPYENGLKEGAEVTFLPEGQKISRVEHRRGIVHGLSESWYADGILQSRGSLVDGRREGVWLYQRPDGKSNQVWSGIYRDDEKTPEEPVPAASPSD